MKSQSDHPKQLSFVIVCFTIIFVVAYAVTWIAMELKNLP